MRARHDARVLVLVAGGVAPAILFVLALGAGAPARAADVDAGGLVNWTCLNLRVSACVCGVPPQPCLQVTYNEPRLLIHTWASPGAKPGHETPQQFHEATAVPFPLGLFRSVFRFPCSLDYTNPAGSATSVTGALSAGAHYSSLLDAVAWRTGLVEASISQAIASAVSQGSGACALQGLAGQLGIRIPGLGDVCMGNWGPLFPRTGWLVHQSEPVGSAAAAYRAAHILSHPELVAGHVVPWPATDFSANPSELMNLAVPRMTPCFNPGTPPIVWESAATAPTGHYVWVYWVRRSCCISLALLGKGTPGPGNFIAMARAAEARDASPMVSACTMEPRGLTPLAMARTAELKWRAP